MLSTVALNLTAKIATPHVIGSGSRVTALSSSLLRSKTHVSFWYWENTPSERAQGCGVPLQVALPSWKSSKATLSADCQRTGRECSCGQGPLTQLCCGKAHFLYLSNSHSPLVESLCICLCYSSHTHLCEMLSKGAITSRFNDWFVLPCCLLLWQVFCKAAPLPRLVRQPGHTLCNSS